MCGMVQSVLSQHQARLCPLRRELGPVLLWHLSLKVLKSSSPVADL